MEEGVEKENITELKKWKTIQREGVRDTEEEEETLLCSPVILFREVGWWGEQI